MGKGTGHVHNLKLRGANTLFAFEYSRSYMHI